MPAEHLPVQAGNWSSVNDYLTLHDGQAVNVKDKRFLGGAKGDGVTDDTVAIQAAITAGAGGRVVIPPGTYNVTNTLTIPSNTLVEGSGYGTVIVQSGAWTVPTLGVFAIRNASAVVIRDLTIDCQRSTKSASNPNSAIAIAGSQSVRVNRCRVLDPTYTGIYVGGIPATTTSDIVITENYVFRGGNGVTGQLNNGVSVDGTVAAVRDITIANNSFLQINDSAIGIHDNAQHVSIIGNTIDSPGSTGVDVAGCQFVTVSANTIRFPGQTAAGSAAGVRLIFDLSTYSAQDIIISHNTILGNSTGNGPLGIYVDSLSTSALDDRIMIVGNIIRNMTAATGYGMYISTQAALLMVVGNTISGNTLAGLVIDEGATQLITNFHVVGNILANNGTYGLHLVGTIPSGKVQNNTFVGNTTAATNASAAQKALLHWFGNGPQDTDSYLPGNVSHYGVAAVARAAAITTPTAPSAAYVQAEAQSMKTAVDAIRTALTNIGITS